MEKKNKIISSILLAAAVAGILVVVDVNNTTGSSMLASVMQLGAIYALVAVSMNLLNGLTGLFSLGQAGFMALGAYTFGILTIPLEAKKMVFYLYPMNETLSQIVLPVPVAMIAAGIVAAFFALLIGAPVLRLKSDYFAIATLGFAEIVRITIGSSVLNPITNGSLGLKMIPGFSSFYTPFIVSGLCILVIVMLMRSSYGRSFKAIREDEIAAEAMGINLSKHKQMAFIISSFFAGIGGALLAMFLGAVTPTTFPVKLTYDILLIVVIGGLGSITGSVIASFLVVACKEWWFRFLDQPMFIGDFQVPLLRTGFRMVVFSLLLMIVVLFFRRGIMGDKEFSWDAIARFFRKIFLRNKPVAATAEGAAVAVEEASAEEAAEEAVVIEAAEETEEKKEGGGDDE
ncbi:MAG: branched-chain amino acid ABC transporter permease [Firmicutes bacterium]|nr:branched-chain amino acid ABC transporter permease [Bacillota bacterium]